MTILKTLTDRNCIHDVTHAEQLEKILENESLTFYCGFDPTSDSLHVGSMLPLVLMKRLQEAGHTPIILIGSATGMIGDPSGKSQERVLLNNETIQKNVTAIKKQVESFLDFTGKNKASIVLNHEWFEGVGFIDFLRDTGKHFSVSSMMAKDSVRSRLENREQGISYTEFSYMLLQAYDFYWLNKEKGCRLQVGGSDQWGNITAGLELIRKRSNNEQDKDSTVFGLTFPLLTTSSGAKFGKTEKGAVWLSKEKTSSYHFYQYWLNASDEDSVKFLNYFSALSSDEIEKISISHNQSPEKRIAQKELAAELCTLVHGKDETEKAIQASEVLFKKSFKDVSSEMLEEIFQDVPTTEVSKSELKDGLALPELLLLSSASKSKGQARKLIEGGGVYVNNERSNDPKSTITLSDFVDEKILVLRSGKKNYYLLKAS